MSDTITPAGILTWSSVDILNLPVSEVIARSAWGEARGLGHDGMQATINIGQNRVSSGVRWWGTTLKEVFLKPFQFSCWNLNDPNRPKLLSVTEADPQYQIALSLADAALCGQLPDLTDKADSYYDTRMPKAPAWSVGLLPVFRLGPHAYYQTVRPLLTASLQADTST